jgi:hypothetical protein
MEQLKTLEEDRRQELPSIIHEFGKEQPTVIAITENVFRQYKRVDVIQPELTPRLRQLIATFEVLQSPDLMRAIRDYRANPDKRCRKYEDFAKELGLT